MSITIREFNTIEDFLKAIDESISSHKKQLGEILKKLEELRLKAEQEKQIQIVLSKLGIGDFSRVNEVDLKEVKLVYNPSIHQELVHLESLAEAISNKVNKLSTIRKDLDVFSGLNIKIKVVVHFIDDIPKTIMLRID